MCEQKALLPVLKEMRKHYEAEDPDGAVEQAVNIELCWFIQNMIDLLEGKPL